MSAIIPPGRVAWGLQLPIQAQSTIFVEPWEAGATTDDLVAVARAADRAGALYVGVCEHVAIPKPHDETMGTTWYHPFTTLGFLAGVTESVRLLSHVVALPYHHPLEVAKAFTTLDALSGGRAIVGVGAGHVEAEFALLGVSFADRGRWVERSLPAIRAALDDEYPSLPDGAWGLDGSAAISPRPVQRSVPIWVGGSSPVAVRRAAQHGDGWLPQGVRRDDLPAVVARVRDLRAQAGRPEQFDVGALVGCYVGTPRHEVTRAYVGEPEHLADQLRPWVEAGANQLQVRFPSRDRDELVDQIERFGAEVAPLLDGSG
ncbi:MAG: TIGR03619 family F420-dependent LLM class oxidoreductase [Acidimicrobiales bacterium]|nr:TIGR03619 family F420-dependent LLM class oxidoreductase [Acidimicrobiales bacterium]